MRFKVGDVVQLKSGGPRMTVRELEGQYVFCEWFSGPEVKSGRFDAQTVTAV